MNMSNIDLTNTPTIGHFTLSPEFIYLCLKIKREPNDVIQNFIHNLCKIEKYDELSSSFARVYFCEKYGFEDSDKIVQKLDSDLVNNPTLQIAIFFSPVFLKICHKYEVLPEEVISNFMADTAYHCWNIEIINSHITARNAEDYIRSLDEEFDEDFLWNKFCDYDYDRYFKTDDDVEA